MGDCLKHIYEIAIKEGPRSDIAKFLVKIEQALPFNEFIAYLEEIAGKSTVTGDNVISLQTLESFLFACKYQTTAIIQNTDISGITFISKTLSGLKIKGANEMRDICAKGFVQIFCKLNEKPTFPQKSFFSEDIVFMFLTLTHNQKHELIDLLTKSKHTKIHDLFPTILKVSNNASTGKDRNADFITAWIQTAINHHTPRYKKQLSVCELYIYLEKVICIADTIEWKHNEKHPKYIIFDELKRLSPSAFVDQMSKFDPTRCFSVVDICEAHIRTFFKEKRVRKNPSEVIKKILEAREIKIEGQ